MVSLLKQLLAYMIKTLTDLLQDNPNHSSTINAAAASTAGIATSTASIAASMVSIAGTTAANTTNTVSASVVGASTAGISTVSGKFTRSCWYTY